MKTPTWAVKICCDLLRDLFSLNRELPVNYLTSCLLYEYDPSRRARVIVIGVR